MEFDYQFFKEIILILIPTLTITLGSKLIINSWQKRNEKTKIKRQILDEYEKSAKYMRACLYNFIRKMSDPFREGMTLDDKVLKQEFFKLQDKIDTVEFSASKLISSLRLYYQNENLVREYRKILKHLSEMSLTVFLIIHSNSTKVYQENRKRFSELEEKSKELLQEFEMKLIKLPFDRNII